MSVWRRRLCSAQGLAALAFLLSRLFYRSVLDVGLDMSPLHYFLQFLDPVYLERDLFRSVMSLHHQAPLLNLLVGVALKLFGRGAFVALDVGFLALGLGATVALADVLRQLGVGRWLAACAAVVWAISPVVVLYEAWLFYPHVVASLLLVAAALLVRYVEHGTRALGFAFFASLALVGLTRSTYGPLWLAVVTGALLWLAPRPRKELLVACAGPLLVMMLLAVKTPLYVGRGYGEAMLWPNLAKKIFMELPRRERKRLVSSGAVSPAMKLEGFSDLSAMQPVRVPHEPTGIPALDDERTPSGRGNPNALEHALIADKYYRPDAKLLLSRYPKVYARAAAEALWATPQPATFDTTLIRSPNFTKLRAATKLWEQALWTMESGRSPIIVVGMVLALGHAAACALRRSLPPSLRALGSFAFLTMGYTLAVSVLVSWGDFPRYRLEIDGLIWVFALLASWGLGRRLVAVRRRRAESRLLADADPV